MEIDQDGGWNPVQGEPTNKKLAQGELPPLVLKKGHVGGPKTAFAFLKLRLTS